MTIYNVSEFWLGVAVTGEPKGLPKGSTFNEVTLSEYLEFIEEALERFGTSLRMEKRSDKSWNIMAGEMIIAWVGVMK